jgi:hypothetical protein
MKDSAWNFVHIQMDIVMSLKLWKDQWFTAQVVESRMALSITKRNPQMVLEPIIGHWLVYW